MNRSQIRKFKKIAQRKGVKPSIADLYIRLNQNTTPPQELNEGDKVRLNVKAIKSYPDYERLSAIYKAFIEECDEDIFTVVFDERHKNGDLVCLQEDPAGWLFWTGDLIKIKNQ